MCGIFGVLCCDGFTRGEVLDVLVAGLRRLEYRGYDSAGVALDGEQASEMDLVRAPGKINSLEQELDRSGVRARTREDSRTEGVRSGIAHTRWATHGAPSGENTHPQRSNSGNEFVCVHNGIVTNSGALRQMLERHGYVFESSTDTEVIPKLAQFLHDSITDGSTVTFPELVMMVMRQLDGAYALVFKSTRFPGELVACKRGSPLILGLKEEEHEEHNAGDEAATSVAGLKRKRTTKGRGSCERGGAEYFLSSDSTAVVEHTRQVMVLEDDDVVSLGSHGYAIYSLPKGEEAYNSKAVSRVVQTLHIEVEQIMKGGYEHFMHKEIHEQPSSLLQTLRGRCITPSRTHWTGDGSAEEPTIALGGLREYADSIRRSRRLIFVACGTSYHATMAVRPFMEELTELPIHVEVASDLLDRRIPVFRDDAAFFVSQSGETAETLSALEYAREGGALCVGVTNTVGSAISRGTHCGVHLNAGVEVGVASTKAYTSQLAALVMIALYLSEDSMRKRKRRLQVVNDMSRLPDLTRRCLALEPQMEELAKELKSHNSLLLFGRGANFATCLEGALKVKEVALMHSEGINAGEMKHGPLALVDESLPLIAVATLDGTHTRMHSSIQQLRARRGRVIALVNESDTEVDRALGPESKAIRVPDAEDCIQPILNIIPLQLLSYHLTLLRGFDVDQPRNLAKSVTTE